MAAVFCQFIYAAITETAARSWCMFPLSFNGFRNWEWFGVVLGNLVP